MDYRRQRQSMDNIEMQESKEDSDSLLTTVSENMIQSKGSDDGNQPQKSFGPPISGKVFFGIIVVGWMIALSVIISIQHNQIQMLSQKLNILNINQPLDGFISSMENSQYDLANEFLSQSRHIEHIKMAIADHNRSLSELSILITSLNEVSSLFHVVKQSHDRVVLQVQVDEIQL